MGRKRRGEGSCHWDHGIQPGRRPALLFLLVRLCLPGGRRRQEAAALQTHTPIPSPAPFCLPSMYLQRREAAAATQLILTHCLEKPKGQVGAICIAAAQVASQNSGLKAPPFLSGLQTLFCRKSRTFSPKRPSTTFLGSRNHAVTREATLPAKRSCCPDHTNDPRWWFLAVGIPTRCTFEPGQERRGLSVRSSKEDRDIRQKLKSPFISLLD